MKDLLTFPEDTGNNAPGVICAANASRFNETHLSQPLTTYATGYRDPSNLPAAIERIGGRPVPSPHRFDYRTFPNAEAFLTDEDDEREIGGEFKRVEYTSDEAQGRLANRGLTIRLDKDQLIDNPELEEQKTRLLIDRIYRNKLRRLLAAIDAAAVNTNVVFNTASDPDMLMKDMLLAAQDIHGIMPTQIVLGDTAHTLRAKAYRAQNNAGADASARLTPAEIAAFLGIEDVFRLTARFQSAAAVKTRMIGASILAYVTSQTGDSMDPSNVKIFTNGGGLRVFREETGPKFIDITVEHYDLIKITSTLGIRKYTVSAS